MYFVRFPGVLALQKQIGARWSAYLHPAERWTVYILYPIAGPDLDSDLNKNLNGLILSSIISSIKFSQNSSTTFWNIVLYLLFLALSLNGEESLKNCSIRIRIWIFIKI